MHKEFKVMTAICLSKPHPPSTISKETMLQCRVSENRMNVSPNARLALSFHDAAVSRHIDTP